MSLLCLLGKLQIGSFQQELLLANRTHSLPSKCCFACGRVDECSVSFLIFTFSREKCHENFLSGLLRELRHAWPGEFYLSLKDPHGNNKIGTNYVLFSSVLGKNLPNQPIPSGSRGFCTVRIPGIQWILNSPQWRESEQNKSHILLRIFFATQM